MSTREEDSNWKSLTFAGFARHHWLLAAMICGALPCWIFLAIYSSSTNDPIWGRSLAYVVGTAEGMILTMLIRQARTSLGRLEMDLFVRNLGKQSPATIVTFFAILIGTIGNPIAMGFFEKEESARLIRTNIAFLLGVPIMTFTSMWINTWGKNSKGRKAASS